MLKLWGRLNSVNVKKPLWAIEELQLPYTRIDAGMAFGVNKTPEYLKMNPMGLVPVIDDHGFVLWESHAIVRYLARQHGLGTLCPADARACADADRWMDWYATALWPHLQPVFWNLIRMAPEQRNLPLIEASTGKVVAAMAIANAHLAGRRYVIGDRFTMGDIPLGCAVMRWLNLPLSRPAHPHVEAYYERLLERPAYRQWINRLPLT